MARGRELLRERLVRRGVAPATAVLLAAGVGKATAAPARLTAATLQTAAHFPAGSAFPAGAVTLAEGVLAAMGKTTKLKVLALAVVLAGLLGAGGALLLPPAREGVNAAPAPAPRENAWEDDALNARAKRLGPRFDVLYAVKDLDIPLVTVTFLRAPAYQDPFTRETLEISQATFKLD